MLHSQRLPLSLSARPREFLLSVLEETEVGLVVVNAEGAALYMNGSARSIFGTDASALPPWTAEHVRQIVELVHEVDGQVVERWPSSDVTLRVRARPHSPGSQLVVLEVTIAQAGSRQVAESLARSLRLSITDARLLTLLWRGMSNEEIAQTLEVRIGTVKSRLFRLYQRLGVKRRPAAVLRAAEVLGTPVS
jgi:DNA-binding CsgD family transcriptional regulator